MGNSNKKAQLMREHQAEMAMIRNKHDENEKKLLIEKLALEHNLEKHKAEIARLAKLDALQYQAEIKNIEAKIRQNDQYHEREKIKNEHNFINEQKSLSNEELKINHIHNENIIKENNRNDNKNTEMKLDHEKEIHKIKNEELDIILKRENEAEKNKQNYENISKNNENNFQCNCMEIKRKGRKDDYEHEENQQNIANNFLLNKIELDNNFVIREKELNNEFIIRQRDLNRKENKDKLEYENRKLELENQKNLDNNKFSLMRDLYDKIYHKKEMEIKNEHDLNIDESKRKTQQLEADIQLAKSQLKYQYDKQILDSELQHKETMTQMENGQVKELEIIKNNHQIIMKKMEMEEKEIEDKRNKETMLLYAQLQRENAMIFSNINKAMNGKDQENNSSNNNGNNIPNGFPMFGMNYMPPYYMNKSPYEFPSYMNMMNNSPFEFSPYMNMMNNYQKPEK